MSRGDMRPFDHSINKVNEMRFGGVRPQHRQQREQASDRERASERASVLYTRESHKPLGALPYMAAGRSAVRAPRSGPCSVAPPVRRFACEIYVERSRASSGTRTQIADASSPFGLWLCNAAHRDQSSEFGDTCVVNVFGCCSKQRPVSIGGPHFV